ncbi:hypothetical protein J6590_006617 [Homalodisca vitripennis]|nr:hypothetical protein J6590_006617 [Homalodisca vitripennis]
MKKPSSSVKLLQMNGTEKEFCEIMVELKSKHVTKLKWTKWSVQIYSNPQSHNETSPQRIILMPNNSLLITAPSLFNPNNLFLHNNIIAFCNSDTPYQHNHFSYKPHFPISETTHIHPPTSSSLL